MCPTSTENFVTERTIIAGVVKRVGILRVLSQAQVVTNATNATTAAVIEATITIADHAGVRRNETT